MAALLHEEAKAAGQLPANTGQLSGRFPVCVDYQGEFNLGHRLPSETFDGDVTKFAVPRSYFIRLVLRTEHACATAEWRQDMEQHAGTQIIQEFACNISARLDEAMIIARTAKNFGKEGLTERALQSLLEIEPLIYELRCC